MRPGLLRFKWGPVNPWSYTDQSNCKRGKRGEEYGSMNARVSVNVPSCWNCFSTNSNILTIFPVSKVQYKTSRVHLLSWKQYLTFISLDSSNSTQKIKDKIKAFSTCKYLIYCCSAAQLCLTLCDPMDSRVPVLHYLPEFIFFKVKFQESCQVRKDSNNPIRNRNKNS